jgi:hypothetical protein
MELMVEIGIAEYFGMAEALGIIAAVFVVVYYSRKQMQALSIDMSNQIGRQRLHSLIIFYTHSHMLFICVKEKC